jgi:hypothetical protein
MLADLSTIWPVTCSYPISLLLVRICHGSQLLDAQKQPDAVPNLVNAHLLEDFLVHLQQVLAIDVVLAEYPLVVAALDAPEILADLVLIPVLDRAGPIHVGEFRLGRAGVGLTWGRNRGSSSRGRVRSLGRRNLDGGLRAQLRREGRLGSQHSHGDVRLRYNMSR